MAEARIVRWGHTCDTSHAENFMVQNMHQFGDIMGQIKIQGSLFCIEISENKFLTILVLFFSS